jgi:hypothetical protein
VIALGKSKNTPESGVRPRNRSHVTPDRVIAYEDRAQTFHGVRVIQRQRALMPHPHPSQNERLVPTTGVTHVLLENDHEFYECDICPHTATSARSVLSHLTTHNPAKNKPIYAESTIRHIMLLCAYERGISIRGYAQRVAARLQATKLQPVSNNEWNGGIISALWRAYSAKFGPTARTLSSFTTRERLQREAHVAATQVREQRAARPVTPPPAPGSLEQMARAANDVIGVLSASPTGENSTREPEQLLAALRSRLGQITTQVAVALSTLDDLRNQLAGLPRADPETERKAELYDALIRQALEQRP